MTLVVRYLWDGFPAICGDAIVSGEEPTSPNMIFPLGIKGSELTPNPKYTLFPNKLRQKLVVLGDNAIIGWAGPPIAARSLVRAVKERFGTGAVDYDALMVLFEEQLDNPLGRELQIVGYIRQESQFLDVDHNTAEFAISSTMRVSVAGNVPIGWSALTDLSQSNARYDGTYDPSQHQILRGVQFAAQLYAEEIRSHSTLNERCGGAFELAFPAPGGGFRKFQECTYLCWAAHVEWINDGEASVWVNQPFKLFKPYYDDEVFLIGTADLDYASRREAVVTNAGVHIIPSVDGEDGASAFVKKFADAPSLYLPSAWLCNIIYIRMLDGSDVVLTGICGNGTGISLTQSGDEIKLEHSAAERWIRDCVLEIVSSQDA